MQYIDPFQQHIFNSLIPIALFIFSFGTMAYTNYRNGKANGNKRLKGLGIMYLVFMIGGLIIIGVMFYLEYKELAFDMAAKLMIGEA
ncbi:hypothetical protein [Acetobacterium sp.]|jgi:tellurite resistance protein TehA-like permease|uniref:hypothetical protein n=1 Tax=Acetobacterium sp. TaxID=1872094 RepID=UPI000CA9FB0F|nr:hypothetical protein [Acetobacterium sp.]MDO9493969.1 hypothetical protein [Acetobacterium sp.]PKM75352.1 MAG: hypothetical protein CVU92_01815 [Firmicutes bacterium HGW-Firmicutes-17]